MSQREIIGQRESMWAFLHDLTFINYLIILPVVVVVFIIIVVTC